MRTRRYVGRWATAVPALVLCALAPFAGRAQPVADRSTGLHDGTPRWHALTEVRLVIAPGQVIERGTLVLKDGLVAAAGAGVPVPAGARVWALPGRTVYPGFIDLSSGLGVPAALRRETPGRPRWGLGAELPPPRERPPAAAALSGRSIAAANRFVRPEQSVADQLEIKPEELRAQRALGFTAVLAVPGAGVFRGQSALLATGEPGEAGEAKAQVIAARVAQHLAFELDRSERSDYPRSLMGAVALARQTLLDARWHLAATAAGTGERVPPDTSLQALAALLERRQPVIHHALDELDLARAARLRAEFGLQMVLQGTGHEYRRAAWLKASGLPVIVPLAFPEAPDVADPDTAIDVPLQALQHWEQAPSNLALLERAGVPFAVTAAGLKDPAREFWPRLRQAVRRGLSPERALAALTTQPAALIGQSARLGSLQPGRIANVVVARGDLFSDEQAEPELLFVDGRPLPNEAFERGELRGRWQAEAPAESFEIAGSAAAPALRRAGEAGGRDTCALRRQGRQWVLRLPCGRAEDAGAGATVIAELNGDRLVGTRDAGDGVLRPWAARRIAAAPAAAPAAPETVPPPDGAYPAGAYGVLPAPRPAELLVRGATLWTQGPAGRLAEADLLVRDGRIAAVGPNLRAGAGAQVIDARGRHVTPGLIDAHSHIAMNLGYNEASHSVTAEVRVGDIIDPTDIGIYRILAGGTTISHVLHGSANTIGGQSQLIKLRWGEDADALRLEGAVPTIKFALGENVKGGWSSPTGTRYPATRMGVEQVLRDAFAQARDYRQARAAWRPGSGRPEPRRDLRLEALVEVLEGRRLVHVHSYRADEILMFVRLARELGFTVAAFQHVLEGYKVADAIASIGAGASTFSDWWAYKMEVMDAVPANAALLQRAGVLTSLNSDSDELARRLNVEAAKSLRHGLAEEEALALVTINPARQLRIEQRVGSLEPGKDADFVIWNGPPLSTYARVEQTWVDGRRRFDRDEDNRLRERAAAERARLSALALRARAAAPPAAPPAAAPAPAIAAEHLGTLAWRQRWSELAMLREAYAEQGGWNECTGHAP